MSDYYRVSVDNTADVKKLAAWFAWFAHSISLEERDKRIVVAERERRLALAGLDGVS